MSGGVTRARVDRVTTSPPSVLHVDDDPVFLDLTRGVLQQDGLEVASESDPRAVPERLASLDVDAVVSDYEMPGMDGEALFERVRRDHPTLPFVLFTGMDRSELAAELTDRDTSWYVQKRGTDAYDHLVSVVREAVDPSRTERLRSRSDD